jgi:FKBP-type peptidyl-prolyl cis-trans isomerase
MTFEKLTNHSYTNKPNKMKQLLSILTIMVLFAACSQPYKKGEKGMEYKIISDGKGQKVMPGNFFEVAYSQVYNGPNRDTVLFNSAEWGNQVVPLDSMQLPKEYYTIFSQVRWGDSLIVRQSTDSLMKMAGANLPVFMKKGAYINSYFKVLKVFTSQAQADSALKAQNRLAQVRDSIKAIDQLKKDDKSIQAYLASRNIKAVKAPMGTYVEIINPGEGDPLDTAKVLSVNYTGSLLDGGKVFDSNVDTSFNHVEPIKVYLGAPAGTQVIKGWTDGLMLLRKNAEAVLYVPSSLGYGSRGAGNDIKPNSNLVFKVKVIDAVPAAEARTIAEQERRQMEARQKQMLDSMRKAQRDTSMAR